MFIVCFLLAAGCSKKKEETSQPRATNQHTLMYIAGANGTIDGVSPQNVDDGGTGSPVKAVPAEGYHFKAWSDGVATPERTDSEITADLAVTAAFAINQYTLNYTATEGGAIEGTGAQTVKYGGAGSPVTALAAEHYHFKEWSDGVATPQRVDRNVSADLDLKALFEIDQYTLTYAATENGTITGTGSQTVGYGNDGSPVEAVPAVGYHFVSWSDGMTTASRTDRKVTADLAVTATFAINQYTLTYTAGKNGTIAGASPQIVTHGQDGSMVTAVPAEHYHFAGWSDGVAIASRADRKVTADLAVTATFAIDQYTLTYTAGENGSIKGTSPQKVDYGSSGAPITAVPSVGYHFVSWSDGVTTASRTDHKVMTDLAVTATFAINRYTLIYTAGPNGTIEGISPQTVNHGGSASTVTAVAAKGYHFVNWSDGVTTAKRVDSNVTGDRTVSAAFAVNTYSIGGRVSGLVGGTQVVLQNNAGDDLTITANGDFRFASELLNADTYQISVLSQPTSPNQTCTVTGGSGTVSGEDVKDVEVTCVLNTYRIGGTVSGLFEGDSLVLQNNGGDNLRISGNGVFVFGKALDDGSKYEVRVSSPPQRPNWTCDVDNAAGTLAGNDVTDVIVDCYPKVVLQAKAGIRKVRLHWNSQDFSKEVTFNLCRAQEKIPQDGFSNCRDLKEGVFEAKVVNPYIVSPLTNDIPYWFQLEASYASGRQTLSEVVKATPFGGLNDSGLDWCANDTTNQNTDEIRSEKTKNCMALEASHPGQDAFYGRDALYRLHKLSKAGYGSAGFDFTKICGSGDKAGEGNCPPNPLPGNNLNSWACTRDNVTGLIWEVKTESGLRSQSNTYSWYNPDEAVNGGDPGKKSGGKCEEGDCDTEAYIKEVNEQGLCGANDWRLPTKRELLSIVDNSRFKPAVDSRFFPKAASDYYWSSSPYADQQASAWQVYFLYGEASPNKKSEGNHVRLVRGRTVTFGMNNPQVQQTTEPENNEPQK